MIPSGSFNEAIQFEMKNLTRVSFRLGSLLMDCQTFFWRIHRKYQFKSYYLRFLYGYGFRRYIFIQELYSFLRLSDPSRDYSQFLSEISSIDFEPELGLDPYRNIINRFLPVEYRQIINRAKFFEIFSNFITGSNVGATVATNFIISKFGKLEFKSQYVYQAANFIEYFQLNSFESANSVRHLTSYLREVVHLDHLGFIFMRNSNNNNFCLRFMAHKLWAFNPF